MERTAFLKEHLDEYITVSECIYKAEMCDDDPALLNFFWNKDVITEDDVIEGIINGQVYGLVKCNIVTPENAKEKELGLLVSYRKTIQSNFLS